MLKAAALCLALAAFAGAPAALAQGPTPVDGGHAFAKECSACHMAYPPELLPRASWKKITAGLSDHFGDDASLDPKTTQAIEAYLAAHAAETTSFGRQFMAGLKPGQAPLRITQMPVWISIHSEEIPSYVWKDPKVKSKANCQACHRPGGGEGD